MNFVKNFASVACARYRELSLLPFYLSLSLVSASELNHQNLKEFQRDERHRVARPRPGFLTRPIPELVDSSSLLGLVSADSRNGPGTWDGMRARGGKGRESGRDGRTREAQNGGEDEDSKDRVIGVHCCRLDANNSPRPSPARRSLGRRAQ